MGFTKTTFSSIFILLFLLQVAYPQATTVTGSNTCDDSSAPALLQSGTYSLVKQVTQTSRVRTFQIVVNYPIPASGVNVAVSTGRINAYSQAVGTDYSIRGARQGQTNIVTFVLLINTDQSWASIQASFLFSSRSDFWAGSFYPDTSSLFASPSDNLQVQYPLMNWTPTSARVNFVYLISGLRTADNFFNVSLVQPSFNSQNGVISVQVATNAIPQLESIAITYIVFLASAPFNFFQYDPISNPLSATYSFQGNDAFSGNTITYEGYGFNSTSVASTIPCVGSNCPSSCILPGRCSALGGILTLNQCFLCGFEELYSNGQCVNRCPVNETWSGSACLCKSGYTRVNGICRIVNCGSNEVFNGVECVCISGFIRVAGVCRNTTCPVNEFFDGSVCSCVAGYSRINGVCTRVINCPTNEYYDGSACQCVSGYSRNISGVCVRSNACRVNEFFDGSSCVCVSGYTRVNGVCTRVINCGSNEYFDGTACVCVDGYSRINGVCIKIISCGVNQVYNGTGCACNSGYTRVNGTCQLIACPPSSYWNGAECICNQGYIKIGSSCFYQCTANGYLDSTGSCLCLSGFVKNSLGQCVLVSCGTNQVYDSTQEKCVCREGYLFSRNQCLPRCASYQNAVVYQGSCVCIEGYQVSGSQCVKQLTCTKTNEILVNGQCQCISGYQYNSLGLCIPNCLQNQVLVLETCQCVTGYFRNSLGVCVRTCSSNQSLINGVCQCNTGFVRLYSGSCALSCPLNEYSASRICTCLPTYVRNSDGICLKSCGLNEYNNGTDCLCVTGFSRNQTTGICNIPIPNCGINEVLNGTICQCAPGFIRQAGICTSVCRINEIYDAAIKGCICKQGYGISSATGLCDVCPPNSHSTGLLTGCICNTGYTWNSTASRCQVIVCQPNASLSQAGVCICNSGYYLDGTECKKSGTCPPRATWDQTKLLCVCTVTGEYLINGTCQTCQSNSAWNGTQCVCRSGYFLINNVCTTCSSNSQYIRGQCVCNFGYFGNGQVCTACHSTCGTCTNSSSNGCLTCVNASYTFSSGICTQRTCDSGYFLNSSAQRCDKCMDYCASCSDKSTCDTCVSGFEILSTNIFPLTIITCVETCGDGKKFYDECDDGNTANGDGCSSLCKVESGWTCVNGSSVTPSKCYNILPSATKIIQGGHVVLQGQVLKGISLSYLPANLTANGCPRCDSILNVSVITSPFIPVITVNYIRASQYKFVARFNFGNMIGQFVFNFTVRINSAFSSYFTQADMEQVSVVTIDMALLSIVPADTSLTIGDLQVDSTSSSTSTTNNLQKQATSDIPAKALAILFPNN